MPYISVDTMVFIRLEGVHKNTLNCIMSNADIIAVTKEILNEYSGRAYSGTLILLSFLKRLEQEGKIRKFGRSLVRARIKRHQNVRRINYPSHPKDKKWIEIIIAVRGKYIITCNSHLLGLRPNRCDGHTIDIVEPDDYMGIRCPNMII